MTPSSSVVPASSSGSESDVNTGDADAGDVITNSGTSSQSDNVVSVVCVDFSDTPTINAEAFAQGALIPLLFFCVGLCISFVWRSVREAFN
ncbi:hypothetical protein RCM47_02300 [Escherichia coli]|nr:hypothetical protein [Escherichia coli]